MKRVAALAVLALVLVGCRSATAPGENVGGGLSATGTEQVNYVHDTKHQVGCWVYVSSSNTSISCLPDTQYKP